MKAYIVTLALLTITLGGFSQSLKNGKVINANDSIAMGPSYANDIYYSFENGVVASPSRTTWDIGFRTTIWTASIITNGASGVNLYTYPNADTSGWNSLDTAGMANWTILYDDENDWENGAFNRNSGAGHPDYGWGKYNPINHDVVGDSIYILKSLAGNYFKIWILRKNSVANTYYIRFANLDGTNQQEITLDINPYRSKDFVYYNFDDAQLLDREPDTASWDILYTKYMAIQPNGTPYPVVGVFNNVKVYAREFAGVGPDFIDWASEPMDSTKSPIGWEWKTFDMNNFVWTVADSTAFFVNTWNKDIYKLVFTKFEGSSTGKVVFSSELQSPAGIITPGNGNSGVSVYPNPVVDHFTVNFGANVTGNGTVTVYDMSGKAIYSEEVAIENNSMLVGLNEAGMKSGLYVLMVSAGGEVYTSKFMISRF